MKTSEMVKEIIEIFVKPKRQKQHIQEIIGDLSKGEVGILAYLLNEKNNISSNELENHLQVSSARIASTLNSLEKKGLIKRSKSEEDKRKIVISITTNGIRKIEEHQEKVKRYVEHLVETLGEKDSLEFIRIVKRIKEITYESIIEHQKEEKC